MDLYNRMGSELRVLFKDLFDLGKAPTTRREMAKILKMASQIGGTVEKEALLLEHDIERFLQAGNELKKHALRLEQETREI